MSEQTVFNWDGLRPHKLNSDSAHIHCVEAPSLQYCRAKCFQKSDFGIKSLDWKINNSFQTTTLPGVQLNQTNIVAGHEEGQQFEWRAHPAQVADRGERVHLLNFAIVLGSLGGHHKENRRAHWVADVIELLLPGPPQYVVDFARQVVHTHFVETAQYTSQLKKKHYQ
jgi:hypothetical protein